MRARHTREVLIGLGAAAGALLAWTLLAGGIVWLLLEPEARAAVGAHVGPRLPLVALAALFVLMALVPVARALVRRLVGEPGRLVEHARVLLAGTPASAPVTAGVSPRGQALMQVLDELAAQRDALRADVSRQVEEGSRAMQQERNRLAALMSELTQSVVVCNLDGRVLLYNNRARMQFRALSQAPSLADGAELIGIGRSIHGVFDRHLVAHALESIQQRIERGATAPSAQFVTTTRAGQLLRVQVAPVRETGDGGPGPLSGYVLVLDNVTRSYEEAAVRDEVLNGLIEGSRASLASIQAAIEMLALGDVPEAMRTRFLGVARDEVRALSGRIADHARRATEGLKARWPLEEMFGADFLSAAARRVSARCGRPVNVTEAEEGVWLKVDSFTLLQALAYLGTRLVDELDLAFLQLRLSTHEGRARLDLVWTGRAMSTETAMGWELDAMRMGDEQSPLSVRDVIDRHGGEMWLERDRTRHQAFFRFLLPLATVQDEIESARVVQHDSRPEYYDFDLFQHVEADRALDDRPLNSLTFTVFDTETTGLNPSQGDEIIQIGATRVFNGKLLRQESFEQLVDPGRPIPAASIPIHGITQAMVDGQPRIEAVLPAFHAFAQDTVLVAHNAAFDMKFLQLKEPVTGLAFHQPVLDTLLLSAVVHPNQESHRLEAIADRFGITVLGRHTALGDAIVTAEVFLRLLPLLEAMGIRTLREAREAAQKTYYARLQY